MQISKTKGQEEFFTELDNITEQTTERKTPDVNTEALFYDPNRKPGEVAKPVTETPKAPDQKPVDFDSAGRTTAFLVSGSIETLFTAVEAGVFHFARFSNGEIKRAKEYLDRMEAGMELKPEEKKLLAKFLRVREQHDKIKSRIPFTDDEIDQMAKGFAQYHKATGKESNPNVILWVTIIRALTMRATDIFV